MSDYIPKALKAAVFERASNCCEYCYSQDRFATQSFNLDHIYPRSLGGTTDFENLALACPGCNSHKSNKIEAVDPVTQEKVGLFHPRTQIWEEHFAWSERYTVIIGLTPTGRATVVALQLNRKKLINLRKVLYEVGEHPPCRMVNVGSDDV